MSRDPESEKPPISTYAGTGATYDLDNIFRYHPPFGDQQARYGALRIKARGLAEMMLNACPGSAERTLALRKLEEAVMWANASIARNEKPTEP